MNPKEKEFSNKTKILLIFLLGFSVFVSYSRSFQNGFFYDDRNLIIENPLVVNHEYKEIWKTDLFETTRGASQYYRPLVVAFFAFEYVFFGENAGFYHLTNVLLHFLCSLLVLKISELFFQKFRSDKKAAFFPAFIFALHPANSQAVYWIAARGDIMTAIGILGGVISFASKKRISFLFIPLTLALALLSKETGLLYLVLVPLCFVFLGGKKTKKEIAIKISLTIPVLILYFFIRSNVVASGLPFNSEETFWRPQYGHFRRLMTVPTIWGYYLLRAFFPFFLNFESGIELFWSFLRPQFLFGVVTVLLSILLFYIKRKDRLFIWAFIYWSVSLFSYLNIFPIFESGMEHYIYLSMVSFSVFFGSFFKFDPKRLSIFLIIFFLYGFMIFFRGEVWREEKSVWRDSALKTSVYARHGWIRSRVNLASCFISDYEKDPSDIGAINGAESLYLRVKQSFPDFSSVDIGLGNVSLLKGDYQEALFYISAAARCNPGNYFLQNKLAYIHSALGEYDKALEILEGIRARKTDYDEANANTAVLYFIGKEFQKSREIFLTTEVTPRNFKLMRRLEIAFIVLDGGQVMEYDPEIEGAITLLKDADLVDLELKLLQNLVFLRPADPDALFDLAICAALEAGDVSYAFRIFDQGAEAFPHDSRFLRGKGLLYLSVGDTSSSISTFEEYLQKFPEDTYWTGVKKFVDSLKAQ